MPLRVQQSVYMTDEECPAVCIHDYGLCPAVCIHDWWTVSSSLYTWLWTVSSSLYTWLMNCVQQSVYTTDEQGRSVWRIWKIHHKPTFFALHWWSGPPWLQPEELKFVVVVDCFYIALFSALEQTRCTRMRFYMSDQLFLVCFSISTKVVYLRRWNGWCHMKQRLFLCILYIPYIHAPRHFMQSHICKVRDCLRFGQNDQDLLGATAATWGWNRYQNKSQHRKLTLQGLVPMTF